MTAGSGPDPQGGGGGPDEPVVPDGCGESGGPVEGCELCEAARLTAWFHEDDVCWVAECESCNVPMVVWKVHAPDPPDDVKALLHERLAAVVDEHYLDEHVVDDRLRTIPTHYHAHARPRRSFFGQGLRRR